MSAELAFEYLAAAIESAHGTAITAPTFFTNLFGNIQPNSTYYEPLESRGTRYRSYRTKRVRTWGIVSGNGPLDVLTLPYFMQASVQGGAVSPSEVETGVTYLWEYVPTGDDDDVDSLTFWFGDPNVMVLQGAYGLLDSWTISGDASGTDGSTFALTGHTRTPTKVSAPTLPAQVSGDIMTGLNMQMWLDTSSVIGTTAITGRVISAQHVYTTNFTYKYLALGANPSHTSYNSHGLGRPRMVSTVTLELPDTAQFDLDGQVVKLRVRHNGPLVTGSATNYQYVEVDTYGRLRVGSWGELEGSNRTISFEVQSEVDSTLTADTRVAIQSGLDALE